MAASTSRRRHKSVEPSANGNRAKERKVAIVGKAPSSFHIAPWKDPSWEVWVLNDTAYRNQCPRYDRLFEIHPIEWSKQPGYDDYYPWLCRQDSSCPPVYVRQPTPEIPNHVVYPKDAVMDAVIPHGMTTSWCRGYYTNSVSWMIALAIYEQVDKIGLWGVDMAQANIGSRHEYAHQRPSCELFIGIAIGRGIPVHIPRESDLLKTLALYGFEGDVIDAYGAKMNTRVAELRQRIADEEAKKKSAHENLLFLQGALEDTVDYHQQWAEITGPRSEECKPTQSA